MKRFKDAYSLIGCIPNDLRSIYRFPRPPAHQSPSLACRPPLQPLQSGASDRSNKPFTKSFRDRSIALNYSPSPIAPSNPSSHALGKGSLLAFSLATRTSIVTTSYERCNARASCSYPLSTMALVVKVKVLSIHQQIVCKLPPHQSGKASQSVHTTRLSGLPTGGQHSLHSLLPLEQGRTVGAFTYPAANLGPGVACSQVVWPPCLFWEQILLGGDGGFFSLSSSSLSHFPHRLRCVLERSLPNNKSLPCCLC